MAIQLKQLWQENRSEIIHRGRYVLFWSCLFVCYRTFFFIWSVAEVYALQLHFYLKMNFTQGCLFRRVSVNSAQLVQMCEGKFAEQQNHRKQDYLLKPETALRHFQIRTDHFMMHVWHIYLQRKARAFVLTTIFFPCRILLCKCTRCYHIAGEWGEWKSTAGAGRQVLG